MKDYEKRFLERLVKMYGEAYARKFYNQRTKQSITAEEVSELDLKEKPSINLNLF